MKDYRNIDFGKLTLEGKLKIYDEMRKTANRRLRRLRENNVQVPHLTYDYLQRISRRNFKKISSKSQTELNSAISAVRSFLNMESSTLTGVKRVAERVKNAINEYNKRNEIYNDDGFKMPKIEVSNDQLITFLHSKIYAQLRSKIGSDLAINDFNAFVQHAPVEEVMRSYEEFLSNEISYDEVMERFS